MSHLVLRRVYARGVALFVAAALFAAPTPVAAQQYGPEPDAATRAELLTLREQAWRTWFTNDRAGFTRIVPDELIAIGWDSGPWEDRAGALGSMGDFAKGGAKLTALTFPRTLMQRYGDVVIFYTTYRLTLTDKAGKKTDQTGRGTEVFVKRAGKWIHTGWHLDSTAP